MNTPGGGRPSSGGAKTSVFILDDHEVVRRGLKDLLAAEPDLEVTGEAATATAAMRALLGLRPDVAVLDVRLPDGDGIAVCREVRSRLPATACLILTSYGNDKALLGAIMAGAHGYVLKDAIGTELVGAIRAVAAGESSLDPRASQLLMERLRQHVAGAGPVAALTGQERRVLTLIGEGMSNLEIAGSMSLPEDVVEEHVASLLARFGMHRRSEAAALAARLAREAPPG